MENTENTVNSRETVVNATVDGGENGSSYNGSEAVNGADDVQNADTDSGEARIFEDGGESAIDEEAELSELRRISGVEYGALAEFSGYKRYLELKKSGLLTSEEAFYAVNRNKTVARSADGAYSANASYSFGNAHEYGGSKRHMSASVRKPSSGEVFTRADREELAKWGLSSTGSELERLWREAGK